MEVGRPAFYFEIVVGRHVVMMVVVVVCGYRGPLCMAVVNI